MPSRDAAPPQRARLDRILATTQDAVVLIDGHARIVAFNAAAQRMFGYEVAEVLGRNVGLLMPEPHRGEHDGYIERYERTGEARALGRLRTLVAQRKDGEVFPIELSVCESGGGPADPVSYAAFIRDISDKARLQARLIERERLAAIGFASAKFAHEVGNPLHAMLMSVQLAQRRVERGEAADEILPLLERVATEILRLGGLLGEFRRMSRRERYQLAPIDPAALLHAVGRNDRDELEARGITVAVECPVGLPPVHVDAQKMRQVFLNLCKNAAEAMPAGGTLTLSARLDGEHVWLEVTDTGTGVPEGLDVFEPFATTKPDGTGLGLPVVRQIVLAHGGDLRYESRPGHGTTFRVELPLHAPSASAVDLPRIRP